MTKIINASLELKAAILKEIKRLEIKFARIRLAVLGGIALGSVAGVVVIARSIHQTLNASGFYQYLSLVYSDGSSLINYWQEFMALVSESLPLLSLALLLALAGLLIWSASWAVKNIRPSFLTA